GQPRSLSPELPAGYSAFLTRNPFCEISTRAYDLHMSIRRRRRVLGLLVSAAVWWSASGVVGSQRPASASSSGDIVFVGSSIFHRWTNLSAHMAPLPIVNRAFDGALTFDMLRLADSVASTRPKVIVYYAGSNDVDAGEPAAAIFDRIRQFMLHVWTASPETRV